MMSDPSPSLLVSLAASLKMSYDPFESSDGPGEIICTQALSKLSEFLGSGYLSSAGSASILTVSQTISMFVKSPKWSKSDVDLLTSSPTSSPTIPAEFKSEAVLESVTNLQLGLISSMVGGQEPVSMVTDGIRVSAVRTLASSIGGSGLNPPKTEAESQYSVPGPSIILPKAGLSGCGITGNSYSQMSVMQWGTNPFSGSLNSTGNSKNMKSPVLRFSNTDTTAPSSRRLTQGSTYNESDPYYIILPIVASATTDSKNGSTIPSCSMPTPAGYLPCPCNISEVTDTNVTYICYDVGFICPSGPRRLLDDNRVPLSDYSTFDEDLRRVLEGEEQSTSMSDYGALLASLLAAAKAVLSQNPFAINLEEAKYTLMLIAFLVAAMFTGCMFFSAWDIFDKNNLIYLSKFKEIQANSLENSKSNFNFKDLFTTKSSQRISMNFNSRTAMESELYESSKGYTRETFESDVNIIHSNHHSKKYLQIVKERKDAAKSHETFLKSMLPKSTMVEKDTMFTDFFRAILIQHDWLAVFNYPSMQLTRYLRWVGLFNDIMLTLLFDTLFFMVMYPSGVCEIINTEEMCLSIPSGVMSSMKQCVWDASANLCSVTPPPEDFVFTAAVSLLVILLSLPPSLVMWTMLMTVVNCRPDFDSIGLDSDYWFGRPVEPMSDLNDASLSYLSKTIENENISTNKKNQKFKLLSKKYFYDFVSVSEEFEYILNNIKEFFEDNISNNFHRKGLDKSLNKKIDAFKERMQIHSDGTPYMNFFTYLMYGTSRNRIMRRVIRARKSCRDLLDSLEGFSSVDYDNRDICLCQTFILENFTFIKRLCLSKEFFLFDNCFPSTCEPISWILCWAYIWFLYFFSLYWIFLWGVKVGTDTLIVWGKQFMVAFLQDGLAICPLRIFIFFGLTMSLCKPQLRDIYQTLSNIAAVKLQDGFILDDEFRLVQHFSGACRAARALMLSSSPGARLLMSVDDIDVATCRRLRNTKIGWIAFLCLCTPILISFLGEFGGEFGISFFIPIMWTLFSVANTFFQAYSNGLFITFWMIVGILLLNKLGYFDKLKKELMIYDEVKYINKTWKSCKTVSRIFISIFSVQKMNQMLKKIFNYVIKNNNELKFSKCTIWKNLNREYYNHGLVFKQSDLESINIKSLESFDRIKEFPEIISSLMINGFLSKWGGDKNFVSYSINKYLWKSELLHNPEGVDENSTDISKEKSESVDFVPVENSKFEHMSINNDTPNIVNSKMQHFNSLTYTQSKKVNRQYFNSITYLQTKKLCNEQNSLLFGNMSEEWKEIKI